jgi:aminoglycoside phosphotransferase (APT) family kinase protein
VGTVGGMTAPAEGVRVAWAKVPSSVRAAIEDVCGARVREASTQPGGFSPGLAARVRCADGARFFVKAVSAEANPDTPLLHMQEARNLAALAPFITSRQLPVPRLRGTVHQGPWTALVLDDVPGRQPALPWRAAELDQVVTALDRIAATLTPAPVDVPAAADRLGAEFTGWRTLAAGPVPGPLDPWSRARLDQLAEVEATWTEHAAGDTLLHADIRADNLLLTDNGVVVVDWPWACRGAAIVDLVLFAPSVTMQGGPPPADLLARSRSGRAADRAALTALVCGLAGYLTEQSLRPPPPGLPTVRAFQAAQGAVARRWLAELM